MPRLARLPNISPARLDVDGYQGDDLSLLVQIRSQTVPVKITDWTFRAQIRVVVESESTIEGDIEGVLTEWDITEVAPLLGRIRMALPAEKSRYLPVSTVWDLQANDGVRIRTLLRGNLTLERDVTRVLPTRAGRRNGRRR